MSASWRRVRHAAVLFAFCYLVWTLLLWTLTLEVIATGLVVSGLLTALLFPLYADAGTVRVTPGQILRVFGLALFALRRVLVANVQLARRIWAPSRPIRTGMVEVPTRVRSDAGLAAVGLVTSLIVDNQIVDLDRRRHRLLYHAIDVPDPEHAYDAVNGPIDRRVAALERESPKEAR